MKNFLLAFGFGLLSAYPAFASPLDKFLTYTIHEDSEIRSYSYDSTFTFNPKDIMPHKENVVILGKTFDLSRVIVTRRSHILGYDDVYLTAQVMLDSWNSEDELEVAFEARIDDLLALKDGNPCSQFPCPNIAISLDVDYETHPDKHLIKTFGIKSIDYDWRTGAWKNLVLAVVTEHAPAYMAEESLVVDRTN